MKQIIMAVLAASLTGCAYLRSTTTTNTDPKTGLVTAETTFRAYSLFDAQAQLTKFRNSTGGSTNTFTQGTSVGTLNESASTSNIVAIINAAAGALGKVP